MSVFVDTNVLVYARDPDHAQKQERALAWMGHLWASGEGRISAQVLNEYYVTVTRRLNPGLSHVEARADIDDLISWDPQPIDAALIQRAFEITEAAQLSHWDALIVAAARRARCDLSPDRESQRRAAYRHRYRDSAHSPTSQAFVDPIPLA